MIQDEKWKAEYESLMRDLGFHGSDAENAENRRHARLAFKTGTVNSVKLEPFAFQIINISVGGISFYSDIPLPSGQPITINLNDELRFYLQVDACHMEELEPVMMVTVHKFAVGAKFIEESEGYRVMSEVLRSHGHSLFAITT